VHAIGIELAGAQALYLRVPQVAGAALEVDAAGLAGVVEQTELDP